MKQLKKIIPICLLVLALVISVTLLTRKAEAATEDELIFSLNSDGKGYTVSGCYETAVGEMIVPETYNGLPVTAIGDRAFSRCSNLTSITIPNSVTSIGDYAFSACSGLTGITLPDGISGIGVAAFNACYSLQSITIPDGARYIGERAFNGCCSTWALRSTMRSSFPQSWRQ